MPSGVKVSNNKISSYRFSKLSMFYTIYIIPSHLHRPKGEDALLVEEHPGLLLVLFPLHYVQERGRPLVRNLGKIYFLPKFAGSWKNSCEHFTFILTLGSTWDMFMDLPPADGSNCQRAWDFFTVIGGPRGEKRVFVWLGKVKLGILQHKSNTTTI